MGEKKRKQLQENPEAPYLDKLAPNAAVFRTCIKTLQSHNIDAKENKVVDYIKLRAQEAQIFDVGDIASKFPLGESDIGNKESSIFNLRAYLPCDEFFIVFPYGSRGIHLAAFIQNSKIGETSQIGFFIAIYHSKDKGALLVPTMAHLVGNGKLESRVIGDGGDPGPDQEKLFAGIQYKIAQVLAALLIGLRDRPRIIRETYSVSSSGRAVTNWVDARPPAMTVKVLDLNAPIVTYISPRDSSGKGFGTQQRPHERPATQRTLRSERYKHKRGQTISVRAYSVNGGTGQPAITVVKGLKP